MRIPAHAFGPRYDLPIPLYLFVLGGAAVVVVSFLLVLLRGEFGRTRTEPDVQDGAHLRAFHPLWGVLSVLWLAFICWGGFFGSQEQSENIITTWVWIIVWIAVPLSVAIAGDWTQPLNPFLFLARVTGSARLRHAVLGGPDPLPWPQRLGWWPAVVLFFAAACGELIFNLTATIPHVTAILLTGYATLSMLGGLLFGDEWLRRGELFTVLYDTWGRMGFFRFGAPGRRGFAGGLELGFAGSVSRVAFVLLMLLNVNFDGLLATPQWNFDVLRNLPGSLGVYGTEQHWFNVAAFTLMAVTLAIVLAMFAYASSAAGLHRATPLAATANLLPSLVPIAFGYLLAHNLQYLLVSGQLLFPLIGNPPGMESWPLHLPYPFNDSYEPNHTFLPSSFYWYASLVVIIAVHVYAVVIAHRHLVRLAPDARLARLSEYPWLVAMVGYTCLSLWLIAQPLTEETPTTSGSAAPLSHPLVSTAYTTPSLNVAVTSARMRVPSSTVAVAHLPDTKGFLRNTRRERHR